MDDSRTKKSATFVRLRFWLWVLFGLFVLYFAGYFAIMDRNRPEAFGAFKNYQSSFRWARPMTDKAGNPTKFPGTTFWNMIYEPMDTLYFRFSPRSREEKERSRDFGYDIRDLR